MAVRVFTVAGVLIHLAHGFFQAGRVYADLARQFTDSVRLSEETLVLITFGTDQSGRNLLLYRGPTK
jgi:hypothetical protein